MLLLQLGKKLAFGLLLLLYACSVSNNDAEKLPSGVNLVAVVGAIHGQHRRSDSYSLEILRDAIVKFDPDVVMVELPPDRFETASANFTQYGEVREGRADDFPELTDVVFPLREKLGFEIIPIAVWTQEIADTRRATLARIEQDPKRADDWAQYQAAIRGYSKAISGRSDDPQFVHSEAYDAAVEKRQQSYEELFGGDLGAGGWRATNEAHLANMTTELDKLTGQGKRILILFGAWHKYKILEQLDARTDVQITDAAELFDH